MRKKPSFDQYKDIGNRFKRLRNEIVQLQIDSEELFGKDEVAEMRFVSKNLNKVRDKLDDRVFNDYYWKSTKELTEVFYGQIDDESISENERVNEYE